MREINIKNNQMAVITANFDEVRADLQENLKAYEIEVTQDSVKDAKKQATELNKLANEIKEAGRVAIAEQMKPIDDFKSKINELYTLCKDARGAITQQVSVFEDKERLRGAMKVLEYANSIYDLKGVSENNRYLFDTELQKVAGINSLTAKGELNKATKEKADLVIERAVTKQLQDELEKKEAEAREAEAQKALNEIKEQARAEGFKDGIKEGVKEVEKSTNIQADQKEDQEPKRTDGKSVYEVTITYEVIAKSGVPSDIILDKTIDKFMSGEILAKNLRVKEK